MLPGMVQQAGVARVDIFFSLWFISTLYFIYRWRDTGGAAHLALAGICWGLFAGTKSLAALFSVCLLPAFIAAAIPRGAKKALEAALVVIAVAAVSGGFWYVRNWIVTGNPLYPLNVAAGGATLFAGAYGGGAMETFHTSDPRELLRIVKLFLGFGPGAFLGLSCAGALALTMARGAAEDGAALARRLYVLFLPAAALVLFWFVNPHNNLTNGRFLFPAFTLACLYPALAAEKLRGKFTGAALMWFAPAAFIAGALQPGCDHLAKMLPDIISVAAGETGQMLSPAMWALRCLAAAVAGAGAGAVFVMRKKSAVAAGTFAAAALMLVAGMCLTWNYYGSLKYAWLSNAGVAGRGWNAFDRSVSGSVTVANVGNERAYPLFGAGLRNRVVMVNVDGRREAQFHDYERAARRAGKHWDMDSERPQLHRAGADPEAWMNNLRAEGVQLLFCANLEPIAMRFMKHTQDGFPVEVEWMRQRPDLFRRIYAGRGDAGGGDTTAVEIYAFRAGVPGLISK